MKIDKCDKEKNYQVLKLIYYLIIKFTQNLIFLFLESKRKLGSLVKFIV